MPCPGPVWGREERGGRYVLSMGKIQKVVVLSSKTWITVFTPIEINLVLLLYFFSFFCVNICTLFVALLVHSFYSRYNKTIKGLKIETKFLEHEDTTTKCHLTVTDSVVNYKSVNTEHNCCITHAHSIIHLTVYVFSFKIHPIQLIKRSIYLVFHRTTCRSLVQISLPLCY